MGRYFFGDSCSPAVNLFQIDRVNLFGNRLLYRGADFFCLEPNGVHPGTFESEITRLRSAGVAHTRVIEDEVVLLIGPAYDIFGHWLIDFMPRIQVLIEAGFKPQELKFLLPSDLPDFALEWLGLIGISSGQVIRYDIHREICQIRRALIPSNLRGDGRASPLMARAAETFREGALGRQQPQQLRRTFISRNRWQNGAKGHRQITNGAELEQIASDHGYDIVHPQDLGIREFMSVVLESRVIVGEYGSGMHWSIFAQPSTDIVCLRGTLGHPGFLQSGLCEALGQRHGYVFGTTREEGPYHVSTFDRDDLRACLKLIETA